MTQQCSHHCPESLRDGVVVLGNSDYNLTTVVKIVIYRVIKNCPKPLVSMVGATGFEPATSWTPFNSICISCFFSLVLTVLVSLAYRHIPVY